MYVYMLIIQINFILLIVSRNQINRSKTQLNKLTVFKNVSMR